MIYVFGAKIELGSALRLGCWISCNLGYQRVVFLNEGSACVGDPENSKNGLGLSF